MQDSPTNYVSPFGSRSYLRELELLGFEEVPEDQLWIDVLFDEAELDKYLSREEGWFRNELVGMFASEKEAEEFVFRFIVTADIVSDESIYHMYSMQRNVFHEYVKNQLERLVHFQDYFLHVECIPSLFLLNLAFPAQFSAFINWYVPSDTNLHHVATHIKNGADADIALQLGIAGIDHNIAASMDVYRTTSLT